jgi:hypothetical protein
MIRVDNLYRHEDGGLYCLMIPDAPMKHPDSGEWIAGVIYLGKDGQARSTSRARWDDRFTQVSAIHEDKLDAEEMAMVRRSNPGDSDLDFIRVFESWHESEINITGNMLELAVAATIKQLAPSLLVDSPEGTSLTIQTSDLQDVLQNYEIERVPEPHGFRFVMRKSFPDSA